MGKTPYGSRLTRGKSGAETRGCHSLSPVKPAYPAASELSGEAAGSSGRHDELYRTFFGNVQESVAITEAVRDKQGRIVDWVYRDANDQHLLARGWKREAVLGRRVSEVISREVVAKFLPAYTKVLETGQPYNYETFFKGMHLQVSVFRLDPDSIAITSIDITERKRAEQELLILTREALLQKNLLSQVLENFTEHVYLLDRHLCLIYVNSVGPRERGLTPGDYLGKTWGETGFLADKAEAFELEVLSVFETGASISGTAWDKTSEGLLKEYEYDLNPVLSLEDTIQYVLATFRDVTGRRKAEEALRLDEARLEALADLNNMADSSEAELFDYALESALKITESLYGVILLVSPDEQTARIVSLSGQLTDDCRNPGDQILDVMSLGLWRAVFETRQPQVVNDYVWWSTAQKRLPQGHLPVSRFLAVPTIEQGRIVAICVLGNKKIWYTDADVRQLSLLMYGMWRIIARKRAERDVQEARARAELYLDLMGHDINNLHQVALGFLEMAQDLAASGGEPGVLLDRPIEALKRSTQIIDTVRKLQKVRVEGQNLEPIDLPKILQDVRAEYLRPGVDIRLSVPPDGPREVPANRLLYDVFSNLVGNAIKHSTGGAVTVSIVMGKESRDGRPYYRVSVEDDGPGIPDHLKSRIFNRLQRGETGAKGLGLGLYLVKSLVDSYGGLVWVEDRVPGDHTLGARFLVLLPVAEKV